MSSRTPSPSRTGRDKHFPNKHETHASDSPQKKVVSNMNENENEAGENGSKELPIFRGPEGGTMKYDIKELKRITVRIERSLPKPEVARKIIDPKSIAPVRRPDEGKQPLFSRIAGCSSTNSSGEPSSSNKPIERDKRKSRSRSPAYHSRHRSRKRSGSPSSKRRYHSPTPPHYRHRHSNRHSPGRDAHYESRRSSKRSSSSERDLRKAPSSERDYVKRERRRSSSRSPHRYKERSSREEEERDRHHGRRRSSDRDERDRRSHSCSRDRSPHSSQRDHSYQPKNRMSEVVRTPHMLEPHPGMVPMGPMVMGSVMHPFTPFVPPVMVRPPPPGFRPFRPGPFHPLPFRPLRRNPRHTPPRQTKSQPSEQK